PHIQQPGTHHVLGSRAGGAGAAGNGAAQVRHVSCEPPGKVVMKFPSFDPSATVPATGGGDRPVLVVESDADQRRRVTAQLANWGYAPVAAGSGEEAIELVANAHFAFSLVAIRLPGMSGVDFLRRAQDLCDTGHVIMVADNGHSSQIVEAIQTGADDFMRRPYTAEDLENAIKAVAGRPRPVPAPTAAADRESTRLNPSHGSASFAVLCLK